VEFHQRGITMDNYRQVLSDIRGKSIYMMGQCSTSGLPFLMGHIYNDFDARFLCVSPTSLEKIRPDKFPWQIIKKNLSLSDSELAGFIESAHDPKATNDPTNKPSSKYRYDKGHEPEKRVGVMIKLAMAKALAIEVDGTVYRENDNFRKNYNQVDHYVIAQR